MKRIIDFLISLLGILILFPIMLPIVIVLKLTGEHYIFYFQPRIGKNGNEFRIVKFSTMLLNSPNIGPGEITIRNDPRVFPFGRFLRKTKLNEVPQLLNILKGEMSIVGPRPLTPKHFSFYSSEQSEIIKQLKPGLTGVGAIMFSDEERIFTNSHKEYSQTYRELIIPYKAALENWYLKNKSLWVDCKVVFLTVWILFIKKNQLAYRLLKDLPKKPENLKYL